MRRRELVTGLVFVLMVTGCSRDPEPARRTPVKTPPTPVAGQDRPGAPAAVDPVLFTTEFIAEPKPLSTDAVTGDWPAFLGPEHNGVCRETNLLKSWPEDGPRLVWQMETGTGYSAPSVAGDRLVYCHRLGNAEVVECLSASTGARQWHFAYPSDYRDRFGYNNGPRATPVIDESRVYTYGAQGRLHCLSLDTGEVIWGRDLARDYRLPQGYFGIGTTPLLENGLLIVNVGGPGGPCVAAFDPMTGATIWEAGTEWGASYASPVPALVHGRRRVFVLAGGESRRPTGGLLSIDPVDGKIDFRVPWRSREVASVNASCPVVIGERVFISASYGTGGALIAIDPDLQPQIEWKTDDLATHFSTSIHKDGHLYGFDGRNREDAEIVCLDVETGEVKWRDFPELHEKYEAYGYERERDFSTYRGSLLLAEDLFLCLGELGHLLWLDLTPGGPRIVARTWLFAAGETWTPPVISRGLLYVVQNSRDFTNDDPPRLLCYDLRAGSK